MDAGASVIDGIRVGDDVVLGAGAVATGTLLEAGTYVGVPARRVWGRLSSGSPTAGSGS